MVCPHCGYDSGYYRVRSDGEKTRIGKKGKEGDFYTIPTDILSRIKKDGHWDLVNFFGCPACKNVFID